MLLLKNICNNRKYNNKERRKEVVRPLTNYNVLVLDQRFRQNSSVSFVNTNTTEMDFRDANVSCFIIWLKQANSYNLYGDFKYSYNAIETIMALKHL
jgi:hypothetical protein